MIDFVLFWFRLFTFVYFKWRGMQILNQLVQEKLVEEFIVLIKFLQVQDSNL